MDALRDVNLRKLSQLVEAATDQTYSEERLEAIYLVLWLEFKVGTEIAMYVLLGRDKKVREWLLGYLAQEGS